MDRRANRVSPEDIAGGALDACTLNNALNAVQLGILLALLKWVRSS